MLRISNPALASPAFRHVARLIFEMILLMSSEARIYLVHYGFHSHSPRLFFSVTGVRKRDG